MKCYFCERGKHTSCIPTFFLDVLDFVPSRCECECRKGKGFVEIKSNTDTGKTNALLNTVDSEFN